MWRFNWRRVGGGYCGGDCRSVRSGYGGWFLGVIVKRRRERIVSVDNFLEDFFVEGNTGLGVV